MDNDRSITESTVSNLSPELAELLRRLDISPPLLSNADVLSIRKNSSSRSSSGPPTIEEADDLGGYPEQPATTDILDRETLMEQFLAIKEDERIIKWKNNYFHDHLVEHYRRKQMMHVYGEDPEDSPLQKKYLRKLAEYEKLKQEIQASEEDQEADSSAWGEQLRCKTEEADRNVEEMATKERKVGRTCCFNGKPFAVKRVHNLVLRQLEKIREIAKFRVRYARLRDVLIGMETTLNTLRMLTPNLDKEDYERLEVEKFYYQHELVNKKKKIANLVQIRNRLSGQLKSIQRKIKKTKCEVMRANEAVVKLNDTLNDKLKQRGTRMTKFKIIKCYVEKFENVAGLRKHPELLQKLISVSQEHKEWLRRISRVMETIKEQQQNLNALRASYILHDKSEAKEDSDDEGDLCAIQRPNLPPVGGGFLQALRGT